MVTGAVEQGGPHANGRRDAAGDQRRAGVGGRNTGKVLVPPSVSYGYSGHMMDFPGTINIHYEHFIEQVLDMRRSLPYRQRRFERDKTVRPARSDGPSN